MKDDYAMALTTLTFGVVWSFGLSFSVLLATWIFAPQAFNDGQYGMVFLFTFPFGWLVGAVIGSNKAAKDATTPTGRKARTIDAIVIVLGCVMMPIFGLLFMLLLLGIVGAVIEGLSQ